MSGKPVRTRRAKTTSLRQKMWQSMRIMKRFSIPDIMRTVPGSTYTNVCKFFNRLEKSGYIGKVGVYVSGRSGEFQGYALLKDSGPIMPVLSYGRCLDAPAQSNESKEEKHNDQNH